MRGTSGWVLVALVILVGCGDGGPARVKVLPATGKVMMGTQPLAGAQVTLHPQDESLKGLSPRGTAGTDGSFQLSTYEQNDGAPAGTYRVTVVWPDENFQPRTPEEKEAALVEGTKPDRLRGRYASAETSGLTLSIADGQTELPPIELK